MWSCFPLVEWVWNVFHSWKLRKELGLGLGFFAASLFYHQVGFPAMERGAQSLLYVLSALGALASAHIQPHKAWLQADKCVYSSLEYNVTVIATFMLSCFCCRRTNFVRVTSMAIPVLFHLYGNEQLMWVSFYKWFLFVLFDFKSFLFYVGCNQDQYLLCFVPNITT